MRERLQLLLSTLKVKPAEFCLKTGIPKSRFSDVISGKTNNLSVEAITKVLQIYNVNLNWLLTGEGEMFLAGNTEESVFYDAKNGTFIQGNLVINDKVEAKKAYEAYLARSGKSRVTAADSVSLEGLDDSEKEHVINTVKILQDAKKKKGK